MGSVRTWIAWPAVGGVLLVSPVLAFWLVITAEMAVDALMEAGVTGVSAITIGAVGSVQFRRILHSEGAAALGVEGAVRGTQHRRSAGVRRPAASSGYALSG